MSRTIRRLCFGRPRSCLKWHRHRYDPSDYILLRNPPPRQPLGQWVRETVAYRRWESRQVTETEWRKRYTYTACLICYDGTTEYRVGQYVDDTYTRWVWKEHPDFDREADWDHKLYLDVHHEVYRNGSCRRQRINGVQKTKRMYHRAERRCARGALRELVREYWLGDLG